MTTFQNKFRILFHAFYSSRPGAHASGMLLQHARDVRPDGLGFHLLSDLEAS